jgi:hypothetical protein
MTRVRQFPLPDDLAWYPADLTRGDAWSLRLGGPWGMEVALVNRRADGLTWLSGVARYRAWDQRRHAIARSAPTARRWAERWALARLEVLRAEYARREAARQPVRGQIRCGAPTPPGSAPL